MMNDGVADAVMAVLMTVESSPASVKRTYFAPRITCPMWKTNESKQNPARINTTITMITRKKQRENTHLLPRAE